MFVECEKIQSNYFVICSKDRTWDYASNPVGKQKDVLKHNVVMAYCLLVFKVSIAGHLKVVHHHPRFPKAKKNLMIQIDQMLVKRILFHFDIIVHIALMNNL